MEPKASSPEMNAPNQERSPESLSQVPNPEYSPELPRVTPETEPSQNAERASEHSAQAQASIAAQPIPIALPTPIAPTVDDASTVATDDTPAVAADEDLIEKEWVDKAKQIISQTRNDPAAREKEVGRLQADYLKKRYGKELGVSPE